MQWPKESEILSRGYHVVKNNFSDSNNFSYNNLNKSSERGLEIMIRQTNILKVFKR
jgi:uncharacterized surface protein with fasciclin (FAS1) repeats